MSTVYGSSVYNIKDLIAVKDFDFMIKLIVVGGAGVGKSSLLLQFTEHMFDSNLETTVGVEFGLKVLDISGVKVKLQIWDTGGQESFRAVTTNYYRGSHGGLLVFDVSNRATFTSLNLWLKEIYQYTDPNVTFILCGNKVDLEKQRAVDSEEAEEFAKQNGLLYIETSAKDATNVNEAFHTLCVSVCEKVNSGLLQTATKQPSLVNNDAIPKEKKNCCGN